MGMGMRSGIRMGMRMSKPARVRAGMAGAHSHEPPSPLWMCAELGGVHHHHRGCQSAISLSVGPLSPHFVVSLVRFVSPLSG